MSMKGFFKWKISMVRLSSREQLQKDFGEFPPYPLQSKNMGPGKFNIIYLNRITKCLFDIKSTVELFRYLYRNPNDEYALLLLEKFGDKDPFEQIRNAKNEFVQFWNSMGYFARTFFAFFFILVFPIFILKMLFPLSKLSMSILEGGSEFEGMGGFFSPLPDNRGSIYINTKFIGDTDLQVNHIITHEHIHLLQNTVKVIDSGFKQPSKYIRAPDLVLGNEYCDAATIYLLEKDEVEARLHEVILSFYRRYHELPMTLPAFFDALVLNKELCSLLIFGSFSLPISFDRDHSSELYETRSSTIGKHFSYLIMSMRDLHTGIKFVLEVLAPMYVNLLRYYGDEEASFRFGSQIQRPNLYDRLYLNRQKS